MPSLRRVLALASILFVSVFPGALSARVPFQQGTPSQPLIEELVLVGAGKREADIRRALLVREGQLFQPKLLQRDTAFLWKRMRVRLERTTYEDLGEGRIRLTLYVTPLESLRRVVFSGNEEFKREELLLAAGLTGGQQIDRGKIPFLISDIEAHYHREGYRFVEITPVVEEEKDQLRLEIKEGPLVRVGDLEFVGNEAFPSGSFLGLGTHLSGEVEAGDGFLFFPGSKFSDAMIQRDLNALERLYHDYGYLDVHASLEKLEFYSDNSRVAITYMIQEGPLFVVNSVRILSDNEETPLQYPEEELEKLVSLKPGMPMERARIAVDEGNLRKFYGSRGHPAVAQGQIRPPASFWRFNPADPDTGRREGVPELHFEVDTHKVDVVYRIHEGRPMRIRDIVVHGNSETEDAVIRREISLAPGDLADGDQAIRSWRRLVALNYFFDPETQAPFVDWRFMETDRDDWVDLDFQVADGGPTGRVLFGGGLQSDRGPFLQVTLRKDNFDISDTPSSLGNAFSEILDGQAFTGAGQTFNITLAPGTQFSQFSASFLEPDLFGNHIDRYSMNLGVSRSLFFLDTHNENRTRGFVRLGRNFGRFFGIWVQPDFQRVTIDRIRSRAPSILRETRGTNNMSDVTFGVTYNTVEDPFSPVDGGSVSASFRQAGEFLGGDWDFSQVEVRGALFIPLFQDSYDRYWVLSQEGRFRRSGETGDLSGTPFTERFFLGGQGSLRGFDFRGAGPHQNGFALGGEASWDGSTEIRFPVYSVRTRGQVNETEFVRGAFFLDYGGLGQSVKAFGSTRITYGVGLRMRIPFLPQFPISLDFGFPLQSEPRDETRVFSLTFGNF